jgi:cellulose synthase/poly-beta-1,6-N-acetylglucosamine synthase-like glycosyltransferase
MNPLETATLAAYFFVLVILAVYGWHRYYLVWLHLRHRGVRREPAGGPDYLPRVTVQLPLFNEMYVADRLLDAVCRLDYPLDRLDIQVLDDSTDETVDVVRRAVARWVARGVDVSHIRRPDRSGFKAGALENGLRTAKGEFVAVFDADFIPDPDFLRRSIPYFADAEIAMVQARWGHINQYYSLLTRIQAVLLDAHFILEHGVRNRAGLFFNFNGTAGVWRVTAIMDAGGWEHDTLTEDLDLSYRAQLRGWRFVFLPDLVAPAELPVEMNSFKSQQYRWAKGSIQTCRKLLPRILASDLPTAVKAEAFFHLTANFTYPLMCLLALLMGPAMVIRYNMGLWEMLVIDLPLFMAATASVGSFYMVCQRELHADWMKRIVYVPILMAVGIGLAINNTRAVVEAVMDWRTPFVRTPKYHIEAGGDEWVTKKYRLSSVVQPMCEVALGLYFSGTVVYAFGNGIYTTLPFLVLFQFGFLYAGFLSLVQQSSGSVVLKPVTEEE